MRKRNTLYTVNKHNMPLFMPEENLFYGDPSRSSQMNIAAFDRAASKVYGAKYGDEGFTLDDYMNSKNVFGITKADNPFSKGNLAGGLKAGLGGVASSIGGMVGDGIGGLIGGGLQSGAGSAISSLGKGIGGAVGSVNPIAGAAISAASGIVAGGVNALFGSSVDEAKLQAAKQGTAELNNFKSNAGSFDAISGPQAVANVQDAHKGGVFTSGAAERKNAEIRRQRAEAQAFAQNSVLNNVNNLSEDQLNNALSNYAAFGGPIETIGSDMGAIEYGFMSDYLDNKRKQAEQKEKLTNMFMGTPSGLFADGGGIHIKHPGRLTALKERTGKTEAELWAEGRPEVRKMITFARNSRKWKHSDGGPMNILYQQDAPLFAFGGDLQTNGADYGTGLTYVSAGSSHELNPNDGVQMGVDPNGVPNLVEENETVYNDYVYSARIEADDETKEKFHLPKKKSITYAEISKKLEKEIAERPNDPISQAGFKAQMEELANQQERQKTEMEAERAKAAFEALSPEEQTAVMQRAAQEEALAQQQEAYAMQQEALNQQQPSPEEIAMMQQQQMGQPEIVAEQPNVTACGGKLNKFDGGGEMKKKIYSLLGINTDSEFNKWAKDNKIDAFADRVDAINWEKVFDNDAFVSALTKDNPALAHAVSKGYDFGVYQPTIGNNISFDDNRGNWDAQTVQGWWDSNDPAWKEAIKNHPELTKETNLTKKQLEEYLSSTNAFKKGTEWLQASPENRATYLQRIINNPNAPKRAREYALKFMDEAGNWKQGADNSYDAIFNNPSGRAANPGTYWKTPIEAVRGNQMQNLVINEDGTVEPIIGDVPTDWTAAGNYSWATPENDLTYNYYRRPAAAVAPDGQVVTTPASPQTPAEEDIRDKAPRLRAEWPRYAGLFGPAVGLGMQLAGVGRPDTGLLDAAIEGSGNVALADYKPLGNYLTYRPMDIWFEQAKMDANARATDRALMNTVSPSKAAGLLANGYNSQLASGELYRKALEYNDAKRKDVAEFNRGTDQFNADAYNRLSQFNADAINRALQHKGSLSLQAAREKMDADAGWYNGIYGNLSGLFKGISDLGRENAQWNMIARNGADGVYGNLGDSWTGQTILEDEKKKKRACGGKLKKGKKRGLTF